MNVPVSVKHGRVALGPLVAAVVLVLLLIPVHRFNQQLFLWLNSLYTPVGDMFWLTFTTVGDGLFLGIIAGAFVVRNPRVTALGLLLIVLSSVAVHVIKFAFPTPRPAQALGAVHIVGPLLRSGSFPSGHTASAISVALAVWYGCHSRVVGWVAMIVGILIALSRIFVGAHFPQDVVGGAACALASFVFVHALVWPALQRRIPDRPIQARRSFRLACLIEMVVTLFAILVWGPYGAESPVVGIALGIAVLTFVVSGYIKIRNDEAVFSSQS